MGSPGTMKTKRSSCAVSAMLLCLSLTASCGVFGDRRNVADATVVPFDCNAPDHSEPDDTEAILELCFDLSQCYRSQTEIVNAAVQSGMVHRLPKRKDPADETRVRRLARMKTLDSVFRRMADSLAAEADIATGSSDLAEFSSYIDVEEDGLMRSLASSLKTVWGHNRLDFSCLADWGSEPQEEGTAPSPASLKHLLEEEWHEAREEWERFDRIYRFSSH